MNRRAAAVAFICVAIVTWVLHDVQWADGTRWVADGSLSGAGIFFLLVAGLVQWFASRDD